MRCFLGMRGQTTTGTRCYDLRQVTAGGAQAQGVRARSSSARTGVCRRSACCPCLPNCARDPSPARTPGENRYTSASPAATTPCSRSAKPAVALCGGASDAAGSTWSTRDSAANTRCLGESPRRGCRSVGAPAGTSPKFRYRSCGRPMQTTFQSSTLPLTGRLAGSRGVTSLNGSSEERLLVGDRGQQHDRCRFQIVDSGQRS